MCEKSSKNYQRFEISILDDKNSRKTPRLDFQMKRKKMRTDRDNEIPEF